MNDSERENGEVAEITDGVELSSWPEEPSRLIVRRKRPHSGRQLSFTDHDSSHERPGSLELPTDTLASRANDSTESSHPGERQHTTTHPHLSRHNVPSAVTPAGVLHDPG